MMGQVTDDIHSSLKFLNYDVEEISFNKNSNFKKKKVKLDIKVSKDVNLIDISDKNKEKYAISLNLNLFEEAVKNNYPFSLFIRITGFFEMICNETNKKEDLINLNTVAILFPYLRSLVSTITANANVQPLIMPPININRLIEKEDLTNKADD